MMPKPKTNLFFSQIQDMCRYQILHETNDVIEQISRLYLLRIDLEVH